LAEAAQLTPCEQLAQSTCYLTEEEKDDWPAGGRDMALELWGEGVDLPHRFIELPSSARSELTAALEHREALK